MATTNKSWDEDQVIASAEEAPVSTNVQTIQELYLAYYGRPADPEGLDFWVAKMEELDDLDAVIAGFVASDEAAERVETGTTTQRIDAMHQNLFGRNVDTAQLVEWTAQLTDGTTTLGQIAHAMTQGGSELDKALFAKKMAVSAEFTLAVRESGKAFTSGQVDRVKELLDAITRDSDVTAVDFTEIVADFSDFVEGTVTLTSGVDRLQGSSEDTVFKAVSGFSVDATLGSNDQIDGGRGNNRMEIDMEFGFSGMSTDGFIRNVQTIAIENNGFSTGNFAASNVFGVKEYILRGEQNVNSLSDLRLTENALRIDTNKLNSNLSLAFFEPEATTTDGEQNPEFTLAPAANSVLTLKLDGAGVVGNVPAEIDEEIVDINIDNMRANTLELDLTGANVLALDSNSDVENLKVVGAGSLDLKGIATATKAVNAAAATGNIKADLTSAGATLGSVTLGDGNDQVTLGTVNTLVQLDGGAGSNTLVLTEGGTAKPTATNFQTIELRGIDTDLTLAADNVQGLAKIQVAADLESDVTVANLRVPDIMIESVGKQEDKTLLVDARGTVAVVATASAGKLLAREKEDDNKLDINASKATALTVDAKAYSNAQGDVLASEARTVTLNVESGRNEAGYEQTNYSGTIVANKATTLSVDARGLLGNGVVDADPTVGKKATIQAAELVTATIKAADGLQGENAPLEHQLVLEAGKLKTMTVENAGNLSVEREDGNYSALESLTVDAGRTFELSSTKLENIKSMNLSGNRVNSEVVIDAIIGKQHVMSGATAVRVENISVVATGLAGGLTLGDFDLRGQTSAGEVVNTLQTYGNLTLNLGGISGRTKDGAADADPKATLVSLDDVVAARDVVLQANGIRVSSSTKFVDLVADTDPKPAGLEIGSIAATGKVDLLFANAIADVVVGDVGAAYKVLAAGNQAARDKDQLADTLSKTVENATGNVTVNATGMTGSLILGTIDVKNGSSILLNGQNIAGSIELDNMIVQANNSVTTPDAERDHDLVKTTDANFYDNLGSGRITLNLDGTTGIVNVNDGITLQAKDVVINASGLLGGFKDGADADAAGVGKITVASDKAVIRGSDVAENNFVVTGRDVLVTGGVQNDTIVVNGWDKVDSSNNAIVSKATLTGGAGADTFTINTLTVGKLQVTITDFVQGSDTLTASVGFSVLDATAADAATAVDMAKAIEAVFGGTVAAGAVSAVAFAANGDGTTKEAIGILYRGDVYVFDSYDEDAQVGIKLAGLTDTDSSAASFIEPA